LKSDEFVLPQKEVHKRTRRFIAVCEGYADARFISALLVHMKLTEYDVGCPTQGGGFGDGRDAIPIYLKAIAVVPRGLSGILIVTDANDDPDKIFQQMADGLKDAGFPCPTEPFTLKQENDFRVAVFLVPGAKKKGTLEHLLLEALFAKSPVMEKCVADFLECTAFAKSWADNQQAKMKLGSLISACCEENPFCSLAWVWGVKGNPIPIDSVSRAE